MLTSPNQADWNYAVSHLDASIGFLTGSHLNFQLRSIRGPCLVSAKVVEASPPSRMHLQSQFRQFCLLHTEDWLFSLVPVDAYSVNVTITYGLKGPFLSSAWRIKQPIMAVIVELWVESLKNTLERM